jgi:DNA primase
MSSDDQIQQVKQASDIVAIIGARVKLSRSGRNFRGLCPFHNEKSPSFFVSNEMQLFKCFGCGKSGDVFTFLQEYEGYTFAQSLEQLAQAAGITLEQTYKTSDDKVRERVIELMHVANEYYQFVLKTHKVGEEARIYLKKRGIANQSIADFELGYAPSSWDALTSFLTRKKNYTLAELETAGMAIRSNKGSYYDRFRGRIMFPLYNATGQIVGFSGRTIADKGSGASDHVEAKYINSPETLVYHKSKMLFGYQVTKQAIKKADRVLIMEGEFDVISSYQAGIKEVVAVKGSAFTLEQAQLLKRLTKNFVLSLDSDKAGQEAIMRAIDVAEKQECTIRVIVLESGKDPDELARSSAQAWRESSKKTLSIYQFYIDLSLKRFDAATGEGQKQISQMVVPILAKITNSVEQAFYVKKLADALSVSDHTIEAEIKRFQGLAAATSVKLPTPTKTKQSRYQLLEEQSLSIVLQFEHHAKEYIEKLTPQYYSSIEYQRLAEQLQSLSQAHVFEATSELFALIPKESQVLVQQLFSQQQQLLEATHAQLTDLYERTLSGLEQEYAKYRMGLLTQDMRNPKKEQDLAAINQEIKKLSRLLSTKS